MDKQEPNQPAEENLLAVGNGHVVTLVDEDGVETEFEILDIIEVEYAGEVREYALLAPVDGEVYTEGLDVGEDEEAVLVLRFDGDDDLVMIETDEEFAAVEAFIKSLEDQLEGQAES